MRTTASPQKGGQGNAGTLPLEKGQQFDGDLGGDTYDNDKIKILQAETAAKTIRDNRFQMLMGTLLGVTCPETHYISGLGAVHSACCF